MAGFSKDDAYYVPRATLTIPNRSWASITKHLLPNIDAWRDQAEAPAGDKSTCAKTFLYQMLPWFVEVLVQDGVFFIKEFPQHPVSNFLRVSCLRPSLFYSLSCSCLRSHFLLLRPTSRIEYRTMQDGQHVVGSCATN